MELGGRLYSLGARSAMEAEAESPVPSGSRPLRENATVGPHERRVLMGVPLNPRAGERPNGLGPSGHPRSGEDSDRLSPGGGRDAPNGAGAAGPNGMANVVIAGGSDETRLLLRGLVRLHHHRVVAEGYGPETVGQVPRDVEAPVFLIDADLENPKWLEQIAGIAARHPQGRVVLLTSDGSASFEARVRGLGVDRLLRRPFAVHDLVEAIGPGPTP
jgi:CheY-like chemotaxis protein